MRLKESGLKTEPAFAQVFELVGELCVDPLDEKTLKTEILVNSSSLVNRRILVKIE
nr:hypothetical protein [Cohnella herbarum]